MDMAFFTEEFSHTLDTQRRVAIPSVWRKQTANPVWFLVPGKNGLLQLIPYEQFVPFMEKVRNLSFTNAAQQRAVALFASSIQKCEADKQGRIQLSAKLLEHAGIQDSLVLVGAMSTVQVWNPERWAEEKVKAGDSYLDMVQVIGEGGESPFDQLMNQLGGGK